MKNPVIALAFVLFASTLAAQSPTYSVRIGYGGLVNLGGIMGIGVEARKGPFALNAALGTLQGEVPRKAKQDGSLLDYNIGARYYLLSKTFQPYVAVNYGLADYEYTNAMTGPKLSKIHDFSFSIGVKTVVYNFSIDPYFAVMPPLLDSRSGVIRNDTAIPSMSFGLLLGYDF